MMLIGSPFHTYLFYMCACMGMGAHLPQPMRGNQENHLQELILFYWVGSGNQIQVIGFYSTHQLSRLKVP